MTGTTTTTTAAEREWKRQQEREERYRDAKRRAYMMAALELTQIHLDVAAHIAARRASR